MFIQNQYPRELRIKIHNNWLIVHILFLCFLNDCPHHTIPCYSHEEQLWDLMLSVLADSENLVSNSPHKIRPHRYWSISNYYALNSNGWTIQHVAHSKSGTETNPDLFPKTNRWSNGKRRVQRNRGKTGYGMARAVLSIPYIA